MKHNLRFVALLGAVTFLGTTAGVWAQETAKQVAPSKSEAAPSKPRTIKIQNVPASLMAYWLDPAHNAWPNQLGTNKIGNSSENLKSGVFKLPGNIERIVSIDPRGAILVVGGSDEDLAQLQKTIDVLDKPLRQVEIETTFVAISDEDIKEFGIDFATAHHTFDASPASPTSVPVPASFQVGFVRSNFTAKLNAFLAAGKAKIISAPRVTAINNMSAGVSVSNSPVVATNPDGKLLLIPAPKKVNLNLTPTINGDSTVTVLIQIAGENDPITRATNTVVNLSDGDTFVLGNIPSLNELFPSMQQTPSKLLAFVTPRIIRRTDDVK